MGGKNKPIVIGILVIFPCCNKAHVLDVKNFEVDHIELDEEHEEFIISLVRVRCPSCNKFYEEIPLGRS